MYAFLKYIKGSYRKTINLNEYMKYYILNGIYVE